MKHERKEMVVKFYDVITKMSENFVEGHLGQN